MVEGEEAERCPTVVPNANIPRHPLSMEFISTNHSPTRPRVGAAGKRAGHRNQPYECAKISIVASSIGQAVNGISSLTPAANWCVCGDGSKINEVESRWAHSMVASTPTR